MPKHGSSLRHAVVVVVAATSLSLATLAVARAGQPSDPTPAAKTHAKKHRHAYEAPRQPPNTEGLYGCTWPYRNMGPPCWSTFPQGDPNYHGVRPGI